ncbi:MAG TPA: HEPN family nuclease, partial [Longimicrobium sp.]|nr:HEPN family nuclease [Longimicrobium sp.]
MEYEVEFERDFMRRTLRIVQDYSGASEATLLLNCLVGLLIVPKERFLDRIPLDPLSWLQHWGISPTSIHEAAKITKANPAPETLRGIVHSLRNA